METTNADNAILTLTRLLEKLRVRVTPGTIRQSLEGHPDFPALVSVSDAMDRWQIDNAAFRLGSVEQLRELPLPCIAHLNRTGGWFRLITSIRNDQLSYWDSEEGDSNQTLSAFEQTWSGVVLIAESKETSGEINYKEQRRKHRLLSLRGPAILSLAVLLALIAGIELFPRLNAIWSGWLLTKLVGLVLSVALLAKQFGSHSSIIDRICRMGTKSSCQSLLDSPGAKLWGWLGWSEVGAVYFAGGLLTLLLGPNPIISLLALCALPYTLFSIYYQAKIARIWCPLCLGVQATLFIEGILATTNLSMPTNLTQVGVFLLGFSLSILAWLLLKPVLTRSQQARRDAELVKSFKRNPTVFETLHKQGKLLPGIPQSLQALYIGNVDAPATITFITNPYCGPCAHKHKELESLLRVNTTMNARFIFFANGEEDDKVSVIAQHLLSLEADRVQSALQAWYAQSTLDYGEWAKQFPVSEEKLVSRQIVQEHGVWCWSNNVIATPTVFFRCA